MSAARIVRLVGCLTVLAISGQDIAAQSATRISVRGGLAMTNQFAGGGGREAGPGFGLGIAQWISPRWGFELALGSTVLARSEAVPECPIESETPCYTQVFSPGNLVDGSLRLLVRPVSRLTLIAGGGMARSLDFTDEPTLAHRSATTLHGGARWQPFGGPVRGLGVEFGVTRYLRDIGKVRWAMAPALVWSF